ncbi:MAG: hypothetical protein ACK2UB_05135 [Anaerolineales bacterium]
MSICFHPALFDADRFESLKKGDILRRIRSSIVPGRHFPGAIDGYDIISFRVEEDTSRPLGSIVDYLFEHLPIENADHPDLPKMILLLGRMTERYGNLAEQTDNLYLGYLSAEEVTLLRSQLERCRYDTYQTMTERAAMVKILIVAERHKSGLILSQQ